MSLKKMEEFNKRCDRIITVITVLGTPIGMAMVYAAAIWGESFHKAFIIIQ